MAGSHQNPIKSMPEDLSEVSRDELEACVQLLAAGVAVHRERFGGVPLEAVSRLAEGKASDVASAVRATLAEAIELVRVKLPIAGADNTPASTAPFDGADLRHQCRINTHALAKLMSEDRSRCVAARLRNISWGGAAVACADMPGAEGDAVWLLLPAGSGKEIPVLATILREVPGDDGEPTYGLRFDSLNPQDEPRFRNVLEILLAQPDGHGQRAAPRLVQRLDVEYGDAGELRATLEDISSGGLQLTVPDPLEKGQSLLIALSNADGDCLLELRARVVHQSRVGEGDFTMYRVGLEFEHPSEALREQTQALIHALAMAGAKDMVAQMEAEELPDPA